jgi:hypothetical protein
MLQVLPFPPRQAEPEVVIDPSVLIAFDYPFSFVPSPRGISRTFGSRSAARGAEAEESWLMKNRRRVYLIDKKYQGGISPQEAVELRELQEDASRQLDAVAPLPSEPLVALEALADSLEKRKRGR